MGILSNRKEPVSRVFVNRNQVAEMQFYNKYTGGVDFANKYIIPLLKEFGADITIETILDYQKGDTRDRFLDLLISKKASARILPAELKRYLDEAGKEFDAALLKIIKQGYRVTATKERQAEERKNYQNKINSLNLELERTRLSGSRDEINRKIDEVYGFIRNHEVRCSREIEDITKDEQRYFGMLSEEKHNLSFASSFLFLDGDTVQIDKAKVTATLGVYASTPQEIALLDKLKQLAALTNEIYGNEYPGALAGFCTFFISDKGKVVLKSDIEKESLVKYAKNM